MKITLSKEFEYKGEFVTDLDLDLEGLTGNDCIAAQEDLLAGGIVSVAWEMDKRYQAALAARALKIPVEDVKDLPLRDFTLITIQVSNFLLGVSDVII